MKNTTDMTVGSPTRHLILFALSAIINVALDLLFVYVMGMGINGAAIATVISQFIAAACCGIYAYLKNPYFKLKREDIVFVPDLAIKVLRLGIPLSLQFGLIAISSMAVQRIVNEYGKTVVAAFTATNRIKQLIHQPFTTLSASISTLYLVLSTWSGAF